MPQPGRAAHADTLGLGELACNPRVTLALALTLRIGRDHEIKSWYTGRAETARRGPAQFHGRPNDATSTRDDD